MADRIRLSVATDAEAAAALRSYAEFVKGETLALDFEVAVKPHAEFAEDKSHAEFAEFAEYAESAGGAGGAAPRPLEANLNGHAADLNGHAAGISLAKAAKA